MFDVAYRFTHIDRGSNLFLDEVNISKKMRQTVLKINSQEKARRSGLFLWGYGDKQGNGPSPRITQNRLSQWDIRHQHCFAMQVLPLNVGLQTFCEPAHWF
jgi:hypothetical protein